MIIGGGLAIAGDVSRPHSYDFQILVLIELESDSLDDPYDLLSVQGPYSNLILVTQNFYLNPSQTL